MRGNRRKEKNEEDEVEELLQAAQDQLLLNLSLNSHIARSSPSASANNDLRLDLDLERRFQSLKSPRPSESDQELKAVLGDDLSARFAALKTKSSTKPVAAKEVPLPVGSIASASSNAEDEDEEDQVEKLIQWAKDAARLDPSPPSDKDDYSGDEENEDRRKRK